MILRLCNQWLGKTVLSDPRFAQAQEDGESKFYFVGSSDISQFKR